MLSDRSECSRRSVQSERNRRLGDLTEDTGAHEQWCSVVVRQEAQRARDHFALLGLERLERVVLRAEHHQRHDERVDELAVLTSSSSTQINILVLVREWSMKWSSSLQLQCPHGQNTSPGLSAQLLAHGVIGRNAVGGRGAERGAQVGPVGLHLLEQKLNALS